MKTIAIAGKNNIAVDVLLYCIENIDGRIVCICNKDDIGINSWQKSLRWFANKNRIPVLDLQEIYEEKDLVFISLEYDRIINPELFLDARLYNVHFSLLPQYKGAYTSIWPLLNGEKKTGVSLHKIEKGIDTGDIIKQKIIEIEEKDCALDIYNKYIKYGTELACEFIDALNAKNDIKAVPQTWIGSTFFSRKSIDFKAIELETLATAYQISNQIRAFYFRPYQIMKYKKFYYVDCEITYNVSSEKPGQVLYDDEIKTIISSIDYDVILYKDTFFKAMNVISEGGDASYLCASNKIIQSQDKHGWSLLTIAVYNNNYKMVKWLVERGANLKIKNNNGTTLLMYAKECYKRFGDREIFDYLVDLGAEILMRDYYGKTVIDYCYDEKIDLMRE